MHYYLINSATGELLGDSALMRNMPDPLPVGAEVISKPEKQHGRYDPSTRSWVAEVHRRIIDIRTFMERFTKAEKKKFFAAVKTDANIESMYMEMQLLGDVDLDNIAEEMAYLEQSNVLSSGRGQEITNGN